MISAELEAAQINKLEAEAEYHWLQGERITRAFEENDSELEAKRVYDFTSEVSYSEVRRAINTISSWANKSKDPITIRLLTPGGDAIAGLEFYDWLMLLRASGVEVTIVGIGMIFSAGSLILQAATHRQMTPNAWLMIHEVSVQFGGKMSEVLDEAKWGMRLQNQYLGILAERSTLTRNYIKQKWNRKDWTLNASEALKHGLIDAVAESL